MAAKPKGWNEFKIHTSYRRHRCVICSGLIERGDYYADPYHNGPKAHVSCAEKVQDLPINTSARY